MKRNTAVAVVGAVLVGALTTGCDTGPECVRDHTETSYAMTWNGKTMVPVTVFTVVCDEYAKEPAK
ncbi:hypothetical protein ACIQ7S_03680 [Streptomyces griseoluteus]|uniref:hypothetical protein n=1 Tax=Streptomyces griseoluteus TaxID=29306 RepID=UPI003322B9B0